jgi:transposase
VRFIDWGVQAGVHVFCAVSAWSRFRFVRFAVDEKATTTLALLAECFDVLGGVPKPVLADRMGCLKSGVVANVVVPTPDYVRFATHYGFRPDFCEAADPESKGWWSIWSVCPSGSERAQPSPHGITGPVLPAHRGPR